MTETTAVYANFKKSETEPKSREASPEHYSKLAIQPWDAMEAWLSHDEFCGFLRGNAIKYLARAGHKGDALTDIEKARHYLDRLVEVERGGVHPSTEPVLSQSKGSGRTD